MRRARRRHARRRSARADLLRAMTRTPPLRAPCRDAHTVERAPPTTLACPSRGPPFSRWPGALHCPPRPDAAGARGVIAGRRGGVAAPLGARGEGLVAARGSTEAAGALGSALRPLGLGLPI